MIWEVVLSLRRLADPWVAGRGSGFPASRTKGFKIPLAVVEKPEVVAHCDTLQLSQNEVLGARSRCVDEIGPVCAGPGDRVVFEPQVARLSPLPPLSGATGLCPGRLCTGVC